LSNLVICLRHGEKPINAEDKDKDVPLDAEGPGLEESGTVNRESLTARGWRRAKMLAATNLCRQLARPDAGQPVDFLVPRYLDKATGQDETPSHRSYQTVLPLARRMGIVPTGLCDRGEVSTTLYEHVKDFAGTAVVCWQHEQLVRLAKCLAGEVAPSEWPHDEWPHGRFDVLWLFRRDAPDQTYGWEQIDQDTFA
jgi:broad specificity phosphatase PhoE